MPRISTNRRIALSVAIVVALLLAGCSAVPSGEVSASPAQIGEQVQSRYDSIDWYTATVERTVSTPDGERTASANVVVKTGEWMQVTYHRGPRAGTTTSVSLSDRTAPQALYTMQQAGADRSHPPSLGAMATTVTRMHNVTLDRTTVVDGHVVAVLSIDPHNASVDETHSQQLWVDTQRQIPVRYESTWTDENGQKTTETIRLSNVTIHESQPPTTGEHA